MSPSGSRRQRVYDSLESLHIHIQHGAGSRLNACRPAADSHVQDHITGRLLSIYCTVGRSDLNHLAFDVS